MRNLERLFLLALAGAMAATPQQISSGSFSNDKFMARYRSVVEPARQGGSPAFDIGITGVTTTKDGCHRYVVDRKQRKYFGYDIAIEPLSDGTFRATFKPLSIRPERIFDSDPSGWTLISIPKYPEPQRVREGDTIALDLMVNPSTGQRLVDYLTITASEKTRFTRIAGPARDLQIEDVSMQLSSPQVTMNGKKASTEGDFHGAARGPIVWFYIPDRGRYVLSMARRDSLGFRKAGEVRGDKITFTWGNDSFEIANRERVVTARDNVFALYVYYDASYFPALEHSAEFQYGAADAEYVVRR
jgi:hypothetical protein